MPSEPTLQQWEALYDAAGSVKLLAPWNRLWDSDLITLLLPKRDEPVFCSVMGRAGQCCGIGVYPGYEALEGYYRLADAPEDPSRFMPGLCGQSLMCYYGDREEFTPEDRAVLQKLNLKFRGKGNWIYFRAIEPGYVPWFINAEQADILIAALQNLAMACRHLLQEKLTVDFENGETLLRFYSPEKDLWLNATAKMPRIPVSTKVFIVKNELFTAKIKQQKKTAAILELDIVYIPMPVRDKKDSVPYFPRVVVLADQKSGMILDQDMSSPDEFSESKVLVTLERHIVKNGRPRTICVRDERMSRMLEDFCRKTDIQLVESDDMPVMDDIIMSMFSYFDR